MVALWVGAPGRATTLKQLSAAGALGRTPLSSSLWEFRDCFARPVCTRMPVADCRIAPGIIR